MRGFLPFCVYPTDSAEEGSPIRWSKEQLQKRRLEVEKAGGGEVKLQWAQRE
eukprot:CAMPEP_0174374780 /NCGR_PEP_ID=MMETSP0811_2-20130205/112169_1 /TAXON_ID=73025 ORGANISM="Eutreptiella gymnastica-like, Strain CCMP1594" /NCGR_SAMPLE_ID=MMETSP0811_2 /ASSEMBLY_ACC=CAM_ASM_000667 /LENGTH=51 /DNA_ID=CAMNT_0015524395 /DNA_START=47 /DNA_END=202 /DNA_ORIENTATION=-